MNNNIHVGGNGPTLPAGWSVAAVADFNRDGHPDLLLFNPGTASTVIWYMNNNIRYGAMAGPTLPAGWTVVAVADFNRDGHPDLLLFNPSTLHTVIWYMNNNIHVRQGLVAPPFLRAGMWRRLADFNRDGHPDWLLFNPSTLHTAIWYMNNNIHVTGANGPTLPTGWQVVGSADFNRDGHPDYLLFNSTSRATVIWYMNNNVHVCRSRWSDPSWRLERGRAVIVVACASRFEPRPYCLLPKFL